MGQEKERAGMLHMKAVTKHRIDSYQQAHSAASSIRLIVVALAELVAEKRAEALRGRSGFLPAAATLQSGPMNLETCI